MFSDLVIVSVSRSLLSLVLVALGVVNVGGAETGAPTRFRTNDVVAFVGGAGMVSADAAGMVETVLTLAHPELKLRFRTLAWEGDTVFSRPRELNFPDVTSTLRSAGATVTCVQFGAQESFAGLEGLAVFEEVYGRFLDELGAVTPRRIVVTPAPFESKPAPLPDLALRNTVLARYVEATRRCASARNLAVIDLHQMMSRSVRPGWTTDGRELSPAGHRSAAAAWMRELGFSQWAEAVEGDAFWNVVDIRAVLGSVREKNRLWFDYWRPMNWAFLGGDRTEQQSSRDHRDPKIRWFPAEMQEFVPLIAEAERRIESLAAQAQPR